MEMDSLIRKVGAARKEGAALSMRQTFTHLGINATATVPTLVPTKVHVKARGGGYLATDPLYERQQEEEAARIARRRAFHKQAAAEHSPPAWVLGMFVLLCCCTSLCLAAAWFVRRWRDPPAAKDREEDTRQQRTLRIAHPANPMLADYLAPLPPVPGQGVPGPPLGDPMAQASRRLLRDASERGLLDATRTSSSELGLGARAAAAAVPPELGPRATLDGGYGDGARLPGSGLQGLDASFRGQPQIWEEASGAALPSLGPAFAAMGHMGAAGGERVPARPGASPHQSVTNLPPPPSQWLTPRTPPGFGGRYAPAEYERVHAEVPGGSFTARF